MARHHWAVEELLRYTHVATHTVHAHFVVVAIVIGVVIDCRMMVMGIGERGGGARREEGGVAAIDWLLTAAASRL